MNYSKELLDKAKTAKNITSSTILDRKADGSTWMYKMALGSAEGDEFLPEDRIISLG